MEEIILRMVDSQGIWAALFVFLLLYTIKKMTIWINSRMPGKKNTRRCCQSLQKVLL